MLQNLRVEKPTIMLTDLAIQLQSMPLARDPMLAASGDSMLTIAGTPTGLEHYLDNVEDHLSVLFGQDNSWNQNQSGCGGGGQYRGNHNGRGGNHWLWNQSNGGGRGGGQVGYLGNPSTPQQGQPGSTNTPPTCLSDQQIQGLKDWM